MEYLQGQALVQPRLCSDCGCHLVQSKDTVASPHGGLRVTAGMPSWTGPEAKYFLHCGDKNIFPATMTKQHGSHLATAPHLGHELSCQGHLPRVGTAGLWGLVLGHQFSSVRLLLLPLHRKDFPSLCSDGLSPCRHDAHSSRRQSTAPMSSCPLVLIPQMMTHGTAKWVRRCCHVPYCSRSKYPKNNL